VSKSTLGRGLDDLLGPDRAGQPSSAQARPTGAGLKILIGGSLEDRENIRVENSAPALEQTPPKSERIQAKENTGIDLRTRILAVLSLAGADVALVAWAAHHTFTQRPPMGLGGVIACAGSILLATLCGIGATRLLLKK
jgi:hypothetical protein